MMATVRSLQDLCVDSIAHNFEQLWTKSKDRHELAWCDPDLGLPDTIPEQLLHILSEQGKLNDETLSLFRPEHGRLTDVTIPDMTHVTSKGLKTLASHRLSSLDVSFDDCSLTLKDVLYCLGSKNLTRLETLRWKSRYRSVSYKPLPHCSFRSFPRLDSVRNLALVKLDLTDKCLDVITGKFPNLRRLDISYNTNIRDISPLQKHGDGLQVLIMHNAFSLSLTAVTTLNTLRTLKNLQHLDLSWDWDPCCYERNSFLEDPSINPNLVSLDLSGRKTESEEVLRRYLDAHPSLRFLGLMWNTACNYPMFDVKSAQYRPGIEVSGNSNLEQMAVTLKRYCKSYLDYDEGFKALLHCFSISAMKTDKDDIITALLQAMPVEKPLDNSVLQMTSLCLGCVEKLLYSHSVAHIQPDTVRQLLRVSRYVEAKLKKQASQWSSGHVPLSRMYAGGIIAFCEKLGTA